MNETRGSSNMFGGVGRAFSNPAYRIYWLGQLFHVQGIWIHRITAGWLIFELTASPAWLGAIGFALAAPILILAPLAGAVSDRIGHRRMAGFAVACGIPIVVVTATLTWADLVTPFLLFILMAAQSIFISLEYPARQSLIPALVAPEHLKEAMGLNWATFNVAAFSGPLFAGLLLTAGGAKAAFAVVVFTFAMMSWSLFRLRHLPTPTPRPFGLSTLLPDVIDGIRYASRHPLLPWMFAIYGIGSILLRPYVDLMPGFAAQVFNQGASGLATLLAASGIGALCMATLMTFLAGRFPLMPTVVVAGILGSGGLIAFSQVSNLWIAAALLFLVGAMLTAFAIAATTEIQASVDNAYRGRIIAIALAIYIGAPSIGAFALGWYAEFAGLRIAVATAAGIVMVVTLALARPALRQRRISHPAKDSG